MANRDAAKPKLIRPSDILALLLLGVVLGLWVFSWARGPDRTKVEPSVIQNERFQGNHIFEILKAMGDKRDGLRSERDVHDTALGAVARVGEAELEAELLAFGPSHLDEKSGARIGDGYVLMYRPHLFPRADVAMHFTSKSLGQASNGFFRLDRVVLSWARVGQGELKLIDARISSDENVP